MDRAEATGLGVAVAGHAALLAALTFGLFAVAKPPLPAGAIEVSFVDDVDLVSASPVPAAAPPPPSQAPETGPVEEAAPAPARAPDPAPPLPQLRPAPQPQPARRQAAPAPARERPPSRATGERSRGSRLGPDLLKGLGADPAPARTPAPPAAMTGEARASINAAIRRALVPCERQPLPAPEAGAIRVDVRVTLNPNGSLASAEVLRVRNANPALQIYERRMQDLALAIVRACTPIRGLPAELYDVPRGWRQFTYQFDPRQAG